MALVAPRALDATYLRREWRALAADELRGRVEFFGCSGVHAQLQLRLACMVWGFRRLDSSDAVIVEARKWPIVRVCESRHVSPLGSGADHARARYPKGGSTPSQRHPTPQNPAVHWHYTL